MDILRRRGVHPHFGLVFLGIDQSDFEPLRLLEQVLHQRAAPRRLVGFAEQQLGDLLLFGGLQQGVGDRRAGEGQHLGAEVGGERQRLLHVGRAAAIAVYMHHQPGQLATLGKAVAIAHQCRTVLIAEADHQLAPQRQGGLACRLPLQLQIPLHMAGGGLHRQLPQCGEVVEGEEGLQRCLGLMGHIDLPLPQAVEQLFGGEVDQDNTVSFK